jgi:hypothetical protein
MELPSMISLFVVVSDSLAIFNLFNVLGIPEAAAIGEITFSILILAYLLQDHIRAEYNI